MSGAIDHVTGGVICLKAGFTFVLLSVNWCEPHRLQVYQETGDLVWYDSATIHILIVNVYPRRP